MNYSYKITRDYGFAPNPFFGYCTLACCKPDIRKKAVVGDWIIGTGSSKNNLIYRLIYLMQVTEKMNFQEYWGDKRFESKKPKLNGSLVQIYGDNIYHKVQNDIWCQLDSHHSLAGGVTNMANLNQDTRGLNVLISDHFIYLGKNNVEMLNEFKPLCSSIRNYITIQNTQLLQDFIIWIENKFSIGIHGDPINW